MPKYSGRNNQLLRYVKLRHKQTPAVEKSYLSDMDSFVGNTTFFAVHSVHPWHRTSSLNGQESVCVFFVFQLFANFNLSNWWIHVDPSILKTTFIITVAPLAVITNGENCQARTSCKSPRVSSGLVNDDSPKFSRFQVGRNARAQEMYRNIQKGPIEIRVP